MMPTPEDNIAQPSDLVRPRHVGMPIWRTEDPRLLTGNGEYSADRKPDRALHVAFLRSSESHALIVRVEVSQAKAAPGVIDVLTADDVAGDHLGGRLEDLQVHGADVPRALAGQRTAANVAGLEVLEVSRGMVLSTPGALAVTQLLDVEIENLPIAERTARYIELGKHEGRLVAGGGHHSPGYFIEPTVIADVDPHASIAQEEIFGPVLAFIKATDFDDALHLANDTEYGLTGSLYSQVPERIERASEEYHVGNLYFNRKSTGAMVGAHPFGGFNMSGTDSKAGGRDYLLLFTQAKAISAKKDAKDPAATRPGPL